MHLEVELSLFWIGNLRTKRPEGKVERGSERERKRDEDKWVERETAEDERERGRRGERERGRRGERESLEKMSVAWGQQISLSPLFPALSL